MSLTLGLYELDFENLGATMIPEGLGNFTFFTDLKGCKWLTMIPNGLGILTSKEPIELSVKSL
jgi:hypothetical protein